MYHSIVAAKVRNAFAELSAGKPDPLGEVMAPRFTYRFYGDHALSGERHTREALRRWTDRVARLLPGGRFRVHDVIVAGWPWNTRIATRVTINATLAGGVPYENVFMQTMRMRWGRVTEVHTLEDTAVLTRALDALAASGITEAHAPPITDADLARQP